MVVSDVGWLFYGVAVGLVPIWFVSVCALPINVFLVVMLRRQVGIRQLALSAAWALACTATWLASGPIGLGLALAFAVFVNQVPQVRAALRSDDLAGIAPATWLFALADGLLWGTYGLAVGDRPVVLYGIVLVSSAATILIRLYQTEHPIWSHADNDALA
jgi:uncharacterized protein with PQ loop repeat